MQLPSRTVSFLFTDIEGSTQLWENHPEQMTLALARHDAILRATIEAAGGTVFKTVGDGVYSVFASAPAAVAASVGVQLALGAEPWPPPVALRVRAAVYSGEAQQRDTDFFGPTLNRVARLLATAHGGQILLSSTTVDLIADQLPTGSTLRDLGSHRLKGLDRPERVYQIIHPDLVDSFPTLRALASAPNNLPQQLTSFIGREREMADVRALLAETRLLTLSASGGSGKTRLALQTAANLLGEWPDGVWFVELAAIGDPTLVLQAVAQVLGIKERAGEAIEQTVIASLKSQRLLLLLDNCEHLIQACAAFVSALLRACPAVSVLATTREPLGIAGERVYRLAALSLPDPTKSEAATALSLERFEAARLFAARAVLVNPDFAVTDLNAPALAQLCVNLDGSPLAIELAAARARSLSLEAICSRLDSRFRLLIGGDRSALPRQQTLRALVDWSYDLLNEREKTLFARLSVFTGGWTLEAAEAVCAGESSSPGFDTIEDWEVLDLLTSLTDKSLVLVDDENDPSGKSGRRYRMLETLRRYAIEKRESSGEIESLARRHRDWALALAEDADSKLSGPDQAAWFTRLEIEHDNLRSALVWSIEDAAAEIAGTIARSEYSAAVIMLRLAGALGRLWQIRCHYSEGREKLERVLLLARNLAGEGPIPPDITRPFANALIAAGNMADSQGDFVVARSYHREALAAFRDISDNPGTAIALIGLGSVAFSQSDFESAKSHYGECVDIATQAHNMEAVAARGNNGLGIIAFSQGDFAAARAFYELSLRDRRKIGDNQGIAASLNNMGLLAYYQADYSFAKSVYEECLEVFREIGDRQGTATVLNNLGGIASIQRDFAAARTLLQQGLDLRRETGEKFGIAASLNNLGEIATELGEFEDARQLYGESLTIRADLGDKTGLTSSLDGLAGLSFALGDHARAVTLRSAIEALRASLSLPLRKGEREQHENELSAARERLGDSEYAVAWNEGQRMNWDEVVHYALGGSGQATIQVI